MQVVWFKKDLRVIDHEPLCRAVAQGVALPLYILEPELWQQQDASYRHYAFLRECLQELNQSLEELGQPLVIKVGSAPEILRRLHESYGFKAVYSHQETGNDWTFRRDKQVKALLKELRVPWVEVQNHGIVRALKNRDEWASRWHQVMFKPVWEPPRQLIPISVYSDPIPSPTDLGLIADCPGRQKGGSRQAQLLLSSFLEKRGENYTKEMSSPVTAETSCSRLSPHFTFGSLSIRQAFQAVQKQPICSSKWRVSQRSFSARLRWHCHFIQKLEMEPSIEFIDLHPSYRHLKDNSFNQDWFQRWQQGLTGFPMIDACMRALQHTGWINFRMRAMLMSFAANHLWLHWRKPALHLARLFTDYEPGIHYSQCQMQSGTTGINAIRIYNPVKQGQDHDPTGKFIKEWIPELREMPEPFVHTPWEAPMLLNDYPMPVVDEKASRKKAAEQLYRLRRGQDFKSTAKAIYQKHGSRKKPQKPAPAQTQQLALFND